MWRKFLINKQSNFCKAEKAKKTDFESNLRNGNYFLFFTDTHTNNDIHKNSFHSRALKIILNYLVQLIIFSPCYPTRSGRMVLQNTVCGTN